MDLLKYYNERADIFNTKKVASIMREVVLMGDKHSNKNKHGKKLTTKELKAQNHLKLMQGAKDRHSANTTVEANAQNKDKKAA